MIHRLLLTTWIALSLHAATASSSELQTRPFHDVTWGYLNPARGDAGPAAANLWGNREHAGASGFLVKFKDGFSSPPHIHNVSYRGIVISGEAHNDDAGATPMWMPPGSFWTQPAGEAHITAARGNINIAYIEIDDGPYLVRPESEAFDNGERPINVDPSNIVWLNAADMAWAFASNTHARIAFLWGSVKTGKLRGSMIKLPANFSGTIETDASEFRAVVIDGEIQHSTIATQHFTSLKAGSYFGSSQPARHHIISSGNSESTVYIRTNQTYRIQLKKE